MAKRTNYNNSGEVPFKKGPIREIVKPSRPKIRRPKYKDTAEAVLDLYQDLVQVLSNNGIIISNVKTLARDLINRGWTKHKKIEDR